MADKNNYDGKHNKRRGKIIFAIVFIFVLGSFLIWWLGLRAQLPKLKPEEIKQTVESITSKIDSQNPASLDAVENLVSLGPEAIDVLISKLKEENINSKWASLYALSRIGFGQKKNIRQKIIDEISPEFSSSSPSIKTMAAGITTIFGNKEGIPILIESLKFKELLLYSEPPELICQYAYDTLAHYTGQSFGAKCGWLNFDPSSQSGFEDWWEQNENNLVWNEKTKIYEIK